MLPSMCQLSRPPHLRGGRRDSGLEPVVMACRCHVQSQKVCTEKCFRQHDHRLTSKMACSLAAGSRSWPVSCSSCFSTSWKRPSSRCGHFSRSEYRSRVATCPKRLYEALTAAVIACVMQHSVPSHQAPCHHAQLAGTPASCCECNRTSERH